MTTPFTPDEVDTLEWICDEPGFIEHVAQIIDEAKNTKPGPMIKDYGVPFEELHKLHNCLAKLSPETLTYLASHEDVNLVRLIQITAAKRSGGKPRDHLRFLLAHWTFTTLRRFDVNEDVPLTHAKGPALRLLTFLCAHIEPQYDPRQILRDHAAMFPHG